MNGAPTFPDWASVLKRRAQLVHQQIAAMQRLVSESGGNEEMLAKSCASYYRLLDEIYEKDMPVAKALDRSDLLLHLDGEGLQTENPRLSLVTGIMGDVRKQVGAMIKTLVSSFNEAVELPREFELGLSSFARGSLYLGFSLPEPNPGYVVLAGDPLFAASRQALTTLGAVTEHINEPNAFELIRHEFADPKLRDAALSAVGQLAPSGRRGVSSLEIGGRAMPQGKWRLLTPETRQQVRAWLEQPVMSHRRRRAARPRPRHRPRPAPLRPAPHRRRESPRPALHLSRHLRRRRQEMARRRRRRPRPGRDLPRRRPPAPSAERGGDSSGQRVIQPWPILSHADGFEIVRSVLGHPEIATIGHALASLQIAPGHRNLSARVPEIAALARSPKILQLLHTLLGKNAFPVRSIFFDKTPEANWLVPWHQDLSIAVNTNLDLPGYGPWSMKDGVPHVQPPLEVLESMATIRIHLDDCDDSNGPLRVIAGSHHLGKLSAEKIAAARSHGGEVTCRVRAGDALIMRPLLLHASSQANSPAHRRVIHLEYATAPLGGGLAWAESQIAQ